MTLTLTLTLIGPVTQIASPTSNNVPASSCTIVYGGLVRAGGDADYDHVSRLRANAEDATSRNLKLDPSPEAEPPSPLSPRSCYLLSLGYSLNAKRLKALLDFALTAKTTEVATSDLDDLVAKVVSCRSPL